jgi:hypothetical protein
MSVFVQTDSGEYVSLASIRSYRIDDKRGRVQLLREGFGVVYCSLVMWSYARRDTIQAMVPAAPGTFVLRVHPEGNTCVISKIPAVAWTIDADGQVRPVTPSGVNDDMLDGDEGDLAVLTPDGSVSQCSGAHWDSLEAFAAAKLSKLRRAELRTRELEGTLA